MALPARNAVAKIARPAAARSRPRQTTTSAITPPNSGSNSSSQLSTPWLAAVSRLALLTGTASSAVPRWREAKLRPRPDLLSIGVQLHDRNARRPRLRRKIQSLACPQAIGQRKPATGTMTAVSWIDSQQWRCTGNSPDRAPGASCVGCDFCTVLTRAWRINMARRTARLSTGSRTDSRALGRARSYRLALQTRRVTRLALSQRALPRTLTVSRLSQPCVIACGVVFDAIQSITASSSAETTKVR